MRLRNIRNNLGNRSAKRERKVVRIIDGLKLEKLIRP
jgi:hypothetical protein